MGINFNAGFSLILKGKRTYREFENKSILMLGKQDVNFNQGKLKSIFDRLGFQYKQDIIELDDYDFRNERIDSYDLFKVIGFDEVHALDISDYEGADIIWDLSGEKVPDELENRFDYIFDGGVLEHIFDFTQALININKMLKGNGARMIHDLPCGNWIEHGFYSFSPTCLVDYYKVNQYYIENIFCFGYDFPNLEKVNVISPDCRYNDINEWAETYAHGYKILLTCEAVRTEISTSDKMPKMQYIYQQKFEEIERNKDLYAYETRIEKVKKIILDNPESRIALYGTGKTAKKMIGDLKENMKNIIGVYDKYLVGGGSIELNGEQMKMLDINKVNDDSIQYIVCASERMEIVDMIRQRIKYLKAEGITII